MSEALELAHASEESSETELRRPPAVSSEGVMVGFPAYNEEVGIGSVVIAAQQFGDEIVVVDDGSTDRTASIARDAGATVIEHENNRGKGRAVKTLLNFANESDAEVLVMLDGDGQHVPGDIPAIVDPILREEADVVIGSRYLENGSGDETPIYRRFGQRFLDYMMMGSTNTKLTDSQSGFRAFSREALETLTVTTDGIAVESELIYDATAKDLRITEVPIEVRYEGIDGQTYHPLRHGLTVVRFVVRHVHDRHPLLFFGVPGVILLLVGLMYGLNGILVYQRTGAYSPTKVLVSSVLTNVGILCLLSAFVLNGVETIVSQMNHV